MEHQLKLTLLIDYFLNKKLQYLTESTSKSIKTKSQKEKEYRQFFFTYRIGNECRGISDILQYDSSTSCITHDFLVDPEFIVDLYENSIEIKLWSFALEDGSEAQTITKSQFQKLVKKNPEFLTNLFDDDRDDTLIKNNNDLFVDFRSYEAGQNNKAKLKVSNSLETIVVPIPNGQNGKPEMQKSCHNNSNNNAEDIDQQQRQSKKQFQTNNKKQQQLQQTKSLTLGNIDNFDNWLQYKAKAVEKNKIEALIAEKGHRVLEDENENHIFEDPLFFKKNKKHNGNKVTLIEDDVKGPHHAIKLEDLLDAPNSHYATTVLDQKLEIEQKIKENRQKLMASKQQQQQQQPPTQQKQNQHAPTQQLRKTPAELRKAIQQTTTAQQIQQHHQKQTLLTNHSNALRVLAQITAQTLAQTLDHSPQPPSKPMPLAAKSLFDGKRGPSPHHFDLPEKHLLSNSTYGLFRSRSAVSLVSLGGENEFPKEKASPGHWEHPFSMLRERARSASGPREGRGGGNSGRVKKEKKMVDVKKKNVGIEKKKKVTGGGKEKLKIIEDDVFSDDGQHVVKINATPRVLEEKKGNGKKSTESSAKSKSAKVVATVEKVKLSNQETVKTKSDFFKTPTATTLQPNNIKNEPVTSGYETLENVASISTNIASSYESIDFISQKSGKKTKEIKVANRPTRVVRKKNLAIIPVVLEKILLDVTDFFMGDVDIHSQLERHVDGIDSLTVSANLDLPLFTEELTKYFNPMFIYIRSANGMPNYPVSYEELEKKCEPIYTKFQFFDDPHCFKSKSTSKQQKILMFNTKHVILPGLIDDKVLYNKFASEKLEIEVHDRDFKSFENDDEEILDDDLNLKSPGKPKKNHFGVASFTLQELIIGLTDIRMSTPILPAKEEQGNSYNLPQGNWLQSDATLNIQIVLKYPLFNDNQTLGDSKSLGVPAGDHEGRPSTARRSVVKISGFELNSRSFVTPFNRVLILTNNNDFEFWTKFSDVFIKINGKTLLNSEKDEYENLKNYRLSPEQQRDAFLDILSGYQIFDKNYRIFIVEGIRDRGLKTLMDFVNSHCANAIDPPYIIYDHNSSHLTRLWCNLTPVLVHVQLNECLSVLMAKSRTYLKKTMNRSCFDCLGILDQIVNAKLNKDPVVRIVEERLLKLSKNCPNNIMINALIFEYGSLIEQKSLISAQESMLKSNNKTKSKLNSSHPRTTTPKNVNDQITSVTPPLPSLPNEIDMLGIVGGLKKAVKSVLELPKKRVDDSNIKFVEYLLQTRNVCPNFIEKYASQYNEQRPKYLRSKYNQVFNYSIQENSTTNEQIHQLRASIQKDKKNAYCYGTEYFSQTIAPVDVQVDLKMKELESKLAWKTKTGFWSGPFNNANVK